MPTCLFELCAIEGGVWTPKVRYRNTVLYTGYDLLAMAMSGLGRINAMYLEYTNGTPVQPTITAARTRSYYDSLSGSNGYLRVLALPPPVFAASTSNYTRNMLTFTGSSAGASAYGAAFGVGSQVFASALVFAPVPGDRTQDIVYNAAATLVGGVFVPVTKAANIDIGLNATITFAGA